MPVQTEIEKTIPDLYKRSALNHLMFGFVRGVRETLHTVSVHDAVFMFMECFGLDDDSYNSKSAMTTFARMQNDLINTKKTSNS